MTKREAILNEINSLETQRNIIEFKDFLNDEDRENIQELNRKIKALREELEKWQTTKVSLTTAMQIM